MRKHKLSLWDSKTPSDKQLEVCRKVEYFIDESDGTHTLGFRQGEIISLLAYAREGKTRFNINNQMKERNKHDIK